MNLIRQFIADESGATAVEYGLIAGLIALVVIGSVKSIGTRLNAKFTAFSTAIGT